jgi:hypothetical protein
MQDSEDSDQEAESSSSSSSSDDEQAPIEIPMEVEFVDDKPQVENPGENVQAGNPTPEK